MYSSAVQPPGCRPGGCGGCSVDFFEGVHAALVLCEVELDSAGTLARGLRRVAYARAVEEGARTMQGPFSTPFGHRRAFVEDRWGNIWVIQNG